MVLFVCFMVAGCIFQAWWFICIQRTYRQRIAMINSHQGGDWSYFDRVSYGEHMRALIVFRDPMKLYRRGGER